MTPPSLVVLSPILPSYLIFAPTFPPFAIPARFSFIPLPLPTFPSYPPSLLHTFHPHTPLTLLTTPTTLIPTTFFHTHRLQTHLALDGVVATDLGQMVGSLSSDNELWLAMVLTRESVQNLTSGVSTSIHELVHSWT